MYNLQTGGLRGVKKNALIYSKRSAEMKIKKQKRDEEAKESLERFLKLNPILQKVKLLD
jgi:hypothetical protein